jgi:hypothetical protein
MQKIKNNPLFIASLVLAITLCFSIVFAKEQNTKQVNGAEQRSTVATFVQTLLNVADREQGGIGEQVRVVARQQNETKDKVADAIDKVRNRSKVKVFLIGTDYKNIGQLRREMVKTRNQIDWLNRLLDKTTSEESKTALQGQIQTLEQEQQKIEDFLKANESKFKKFLTF